MAARRDLPRYEVLGRFTRSLFEISDLLHKWGIDGSHETARSWWHMFCQLFATETRKRRIGDL